jgi:serine/threonine protein phosphatase PrpC
VSLDPGDRLYLFSDGIPEARNSDGEQYGEARTADALQSCMDRGLDESIDFLLTEVWDWGGGKGPDDDVSILAIEIEGWPQTMLAGSVEIVGDVIDPALDPEAWEAESGESS